MELTAIRNISARHARRMNRLSARLSAFARPARGLVWQPEPRSIGDMARGRQLLAGNLLFAGRLVEAPETMLWDVAAPDTSFAEDMQGFLWLDDLAAVGDARARALAQDWLAGWIARYGRGSGPGWTPDLTGRRIIRLIHHAMFLLRGANTEASLGYHKALAVQARFLARRARKAAPGLPRFEALTGLLYAALSLQGLERHLDTARRALSAECASQVDADGAIPTRNPEELLEVFALLTWASEALSEAGQPEEPALRDAIARIAPTLRALRHANGDLARFHGGGAGVSGRLDGALAASAVRRKAAKTQAMGFARLAAGRTSVIIDAASPAQRRASSDAHASTLAFELCSGRRPVIVNCGPGRRFGSDWRRAGRATSAHSTLCVAGTSSARIAMPRLIGGVTREYLESVPTQVPQQMASDAEGQEFEGGHDGYVASRGLTHARTLMLDSNGTELSGEDYLVALDDAAKRVFDQALNDSQLSGVGFEIHFHLHPEVAVEEDMGGTAASLTLPSGEVWVLRFDGPVDLEVQPSVYFDATRLKPRPTKQIVFTGRAMEYATRIRWSLAKSQVSGSALRDLAMDDSDMTV